MGAALPGLEAVCFLVSAASDRSFFSTVLSQVESEGSSEKRHLRQSGRGQVSSFPCLDPLPQPHINLGSLQTQPGPCAWSISWQGWRWEAGRKPSLLPWCPVHDPRQCSSLVWVWAHCSGFHYMDPIREMSSDLQTDF